MEGGIGAPGFVFCHEITELGRDYNKESRIPFLRSASRFLLRSRSRIVCAAADAQLVTTYRRYLAAWYCSSGNGRSDHATQALVRNALISTRCAHL
jgi:hypothetical protein